jgi:predicted secreted hydrolase
VRTLLTVLALLTAAGLLTYALSPGPEPPPSTSVASTLGDATNLEGYRRAYAPRPFVFPEDHGPHPDFRVEWWYATGNLVTENQRRFGYQLTLFRVALAPGAPATDSAWRTHQIYMGHFAVTDVKSGNHHGFERFSRAAAGLAGARAAPFRVWLEDWSFSGEGDDPFPMRLRAREDGVAIDLMLERAKPLVLQGNAGLSQKSAEPGNASYYYSYTRLPTRGTVRVGDAAFAVSGDSWLDREWSTSALGPMQSGWDWFALQLDDGRDLMYYRLRRKDGGVDPLSSGVLVAADGSTQRLSSQDVEAEPTGYWTSPESGDRYPAGWTLRLPAADLTLTVTPRIPNQEMRVTVRYWEGAVAVTGSDDGRPVSGQGYLEMTRYDE